MSSDGHSARIGYALDGYGIFANGGANMFIGGFRGQWGSVS